MTDLDALVDACQPIAALVAGLRALCWPPLSARDREALAAGLILTDSPLRALCERLAAGLGHESVRLYRVLSPGRLWRTGTENDIGIGDNLLGGSVVFIDRDVELIAIAYGRAEP